MLQPIFQFIFFYCWEYPISSSTLVLAHPLKINHLLKTNSFVPCLGTLPSHLDNKDGKRARWRILWEAEEYSKKAIFYLSDKWHVPEHPLGLPESRGKKVGKGRPWQGDGDILQLLLKGCLCRVRPCPWRCLLLAEMVQCDRQSFVNKTLKIYVEIMLTKSDPNEQYFLY